MKIIIHPKYKNQEESIAQLVNSFFKNKRLLIKGSRNMIKTSLLGEDDVNIKFFRKPGFLKSIIYSFFLPTKAKRSYEYANYLLENDIKTPFPIAYIEQHNFLGLLSFSFYISQQIHYNFTFRELIHNPIFPDRIKILELFTVFTFKMHEAKVNFLDHSPGNTLIIKKENGDYDFYLVDLNRMKFEDLSIEQRMDNFKRLWLSKTMIEVIALTYSELSNESYDKLKMLLKTQSSSFKRKTARKKYFKSFIGKK